MSGNREQQRRIQPRHTEHSKDRTIPTKGGPDEVLQFDVVTIPEPGPGELRINVKAIGLNRANVSFREGY
jgi:NADPH:quinone reductase-like Zn-dependent oxidoreductase